MREPAADVARTLASYHRIICARVFDHGALERWRTPSTAMALRCRS